MDASDGFEPIIAMFYSVFHPTEGTKVIHQVPSGVIVPPSNDDNKLNNNIPDSSALDHPIFDFDTIKNYVIPKPSLCNKLITLKIDNYRVLGFPVNIYASHYARNSFGFNFCFVFSYESDTTPYEGNIKRIGKMFRALEEQSQLLSKSLKDSHVYYQTQQNISNNLHPNQNIPNKFNMTDKYLKIIDDWDDASHQIVLSKKAPGLDISLQQNLFSIESLIQQIFQDLNNYSECMIPIDASNSVDLKLFPISPPPPHVQPYDVPIALVKLDLLFDSLWDSTMLKIVPFINGINSISQISELSNANLELTKECIRHLLHYKSITLLDIFQFQNRYTVTSSIGNFLRDPNMANSCQDYVLNVKGTFSDLPLQPVSYNNNNNNNKTTPTNNININLRNNKIISNNNSINNSHNQRQFNSSSMGSRLNETPFYSSPQNNYKKPELLTMNSSSSNPFENSKNKTTYKITLPSKATLFQLYNSLNSNMSVSQWYVENNKLLKYIDIRKFITFGIRNGIICRVHWYPVSGKLDTSNTPNFEEKRKNKLDYLSIPAVSTSENLRKINKDNNDEDKSESEYDSDSEFELEYDDMDDNSRKFSKDIGRLESEDKFDDAYKQKLKKFERKQKAQEKKLIRLMKYTQHMDAICTNMKLSRKEVLSILERIGDIEIIER